MSRPWISSAYRIVEGLLVTASPIILIALLQWFTSYRDRARETIESNARPFVTDAGPTWEDDEWVIDARVDPPVSARWSSVRGF